MTRRIAVLALFVLFTLSVAVFLVFGAEIRHALAPIVEYAPISYRIADEETMRSMPSVPENAVFTDSEDTYLLALVESSDHSGEGLYVLERIRIEPYLVKDGTMFFTFPAQSFIGSVALAECAKEVGDIVRIS